MRRDSSSRLAPRLLAVLLLLAPGAAAADNPLPRILDGLDDLARRYRERALRFTCDEEIRFHSNAGRFDYDYRYVYVRDDEGLLNDYRVPARRRTAPLHRSGVPAVLKRAYSWVFLFDRGHAAHYRYELVGEETALGRPALHLRATPLQPYIRETNEWFADAWVDRDTLALLRIEALNVENHAVRESWLAAREAGTAEALSYTFETATTDFDIEARGMRLPSEARLLRTYHAAPPSKKAERIYLVRQIYRHYRFFDVETRVAPPRGEEVDPWRAVEGPSEREVEDP